MARKVKDKDNIITIPPRLRGKQGSQLHGNYMGLSQ